MSVDPTVAAHIGSGPRHAVAGTSASWPGPDPGSTLCRWPSTPGPGAWVVTELDAADGTDPSCPSGIELGWSADGTAYAYRGTFASVAALSAAVAAMEAGGAEARPHDAVLAEAGFRQPVPTGLHAGTAPWGRDLGNGSIAYLTADADMTLGVVAADGTRRDGVASVAMLGGKNPPWGGIPARVGALGLLAALEAWLASAPAEDGTTRSYDVEGRDASDPEDDGSEPTRAWIGRYEVSDGAFACVGPLPDHPDLSAWSDRLGYMLKALGDAGPKSAPTGP